MMNIFQYIKNKDSSIDPLNEVDALALTLISYFPFESLKHIRELLPIKICNLDQNSIESSKAIINKHHYKLLQCMIKHPIFGAIEILDFESKTSLEFIMQYASVCLRINNTDLFVAFRGTNSTVVGWKEDFVLSYSEDIPSYKIASKMIVKIMNHYDGDVYCGGHSKGGNVAVYAASMLTNSRIRRIYNYDGPGFQHKVASSKAYKKVLSRVIKVIPESSVIGMLLESHEQCMIVKSTQIGILQHNPYTWKISENSFLTADHLNDNAKFLSEALHEVLDTIPVQRREQTLLAIFEAMKTYELDHIDDLRNLFTFENIRKISMVYQNTDEESIQLLSDIVKDTVSSTAKMKVKETTNQISELITPESHRNGNRGKII